MAKKTTRAKRSVGKKAVDLAQDTPEQFSETSFKSDQITPLETLKFDITDDLPAYAHVVGLDEVDGEKSVEVVEPNSIKSHRTHHPALIAIGVTGVILLATTGWTAWTIGQKGSLSHYQVAGTQISKQSNPAHVTTQLQNKLKEYRFFVEVPGQKPVSHSPADAGLSLDGSKTIATVLSAQDRSSLLEKLSFWRTFTLPLQLKVDETKQANFIKDQLVKTTVEPKNATLSTDSGEVVITPETAGRGITIAKPKEAVLGAVSNLQPSATLKLSKQAIAASVKAADLQKLRQTIQEIAMVPVSVTVNSQVFRPSTSTIITWVDPVQEGATQARFEINSGKVAAWIDNIAEKFTSPTQNEVHATNPDGTEKVLTPGRGGSEVAGGDETARDIVDNLNKKQAVSKTLSITTKPYKVVRVNTYDKWLLADLSNHMLYAYENDRQVRAFPMSAGAPDTPTVTGEFKIYSKVRVQTMRGPNTDGTSYNVPNVEWVSYFHADYAIHGNYWRPLSVFGNINTSHGCIGMVNQNSQWVYDWAPIGTPVITYN